MLAFPSMLADAAEKAGILLPKDCDRFDENKEQYPHWFVFCIMQLGQPMPSPGVHYENAKVIAELTDEEIVTLTHLQIVKRGFQIGFSTP